MVNFSGKDDKPLSGLLQDWKLSGSKTSSRLDPFFGAQPAPSVVDGPQRYRSRAMRISGSNSTLCPPCAQCRASAVQLGDCTPGPRTAIGAERGQGVHPGLMRGFGELMMLISWSQGGRGLAPSGTAVALTCVQSSVLVQVLKPRKALWAVQRPARLQGGRRRAQKCQGGSGPSCWNRGSRCPQEF